MEGRNRRNVLVLFALAAASWFAVATIALTVDPIASPEAGFAGAAALGVAFAATTAPLLWLVGFARQRRIAYRGDWVRAIRRGAWVGVLVALFVVMRLNDIFQPPIALFLVALALVAEVTLTTGGPGRP
jgi:hypothetical protein